MKKNPLIPDVILEVKVVAIYKNLMSMKVALLQLHNVKYSENFQSSETQ